MMTSDSHLQLHKLTKRNPFERNTILNNKKHITQSVDHIHFIHLSFLFKSELS